MWLTFCTKFCSYDSLTVFSRKIATRINRTVLINPMKVKFSALSLALVLACGPAMAQKKAAKPTKAPKPATSNSVEVSKPAEKQDPIILTLGGTKVPLSEFLYVYKKNNDKQDGVYSESSLKEYLDLYTNFKLKVMYAQEKGMDTATSFVKELEGYRKQLAQPYLTEKSATEKLVKEAYERMKEEINASHILIMCAPDADPADTLLAFKKISDLKRRSATENFETLAAQYSEDPSAKQNKGNLGYFTALQMLYPFEQAAYTTKKGEVSKIVRTRFGYHILKVLNSRPTQGSVKVAHIMARFAENATKQDSLNAKNKMIEIKSKLNKGEDFATLCSQFSEDDQSKSSGGELPAFSTGTMISSFEDASFALKNKGDISEPFMTPFGWHVVKLLERNSLEPFEKMEADIKTKVQKDSRSDLNKEILIARLKKDNQLTEYPSVQKLAFAKGDTSLRSGKWSYKADDKVTELTLFKIKDQKYSVGQYFDFVSSTQSPKKSNAPEYLMKLAYQEFVNKSLIDYEDAHLAEKHEDFRMLLKEYREGILLFAMMDAKVWSKALEDTAGLRAFYNKNKEKYRWDRRVKATIFGASDDKTLKEVKTTMAQGKFPITEPRFERVFFEKNSTNLTEKGKDNLRRLAEFMKRDPSLRFEIVGNINSDEKSKWSKKRLELVVDTLKARKVNLTFITQTDAGKTKLVANGDENRAVSISVFGTTPKQLERTLNAKAPLTLQVNDGYFQKGDNSVIDELLPWKVGQFDKKIKDRPGYIEVKAIEEPRLKTLDEARGAALSDFQSFLENQWLQELKKQHPVTVNKELFNSLIKK